MVETKVEDMKVLYMMDCFSKAKEIFETLNKQWYPDRLEAVEKAYTFPLVQPIAIALFQMKNFDSFSNTMREIAKEELK